LKPTVGNLLQLCPTHVRNGRPCLADCSVLNRSPILNTKYLKFAFLRFERT
jgi:hypothetical protein